MASSTREQIVNSLFNGSTPANGVLICYLKVQEEVPAAPGQPKPPPGQEIRKPRYILLGVNADGVLKLHKSKRNSNGTFSIGKTWGLEELMALEVAQPQAFAITINARSYYWLTDNAREQVDFLVAVVRCYRQYTARDLRVIGFQVTEVPNAPPPYVVPRQGAPSLSVPASSSSGRIAASASQNSLASNQSAASSVQPTHSRPQIQQSSSSNYARPQAAPERADAGRPSTSGSLWSVGSQSNPPQPSSMRPRPSQQSNSSSTMSSSRAPARPEEPLIPPNQSRHFSQASQSSASSFSAANNQPKLSINPLSNAATSSRSHSPIPRSPVTPANISSPVLPPPQQARPSQPPPISIPSNIPAPISIPVPPEPQTKPRMRRDPSSHTTPKTPSSAPLSAPTALELARQAANRQADETTILANVEEMLEGFEWKSSETDQIEKRLAGELAALENASIHAIVESDEGVSFVVRHLDQAMAELDRLDQMISLYKTQLNVMSDDIDHIESQNKGLQVQTSNQRALLAELDQLLDTINIPESDLFALEQENLDSQTGIDRLEKAAVSLYKAILSTRDSAMGDMAAANERVADYEQYSSKFSKRLLEFLTVMFKYQADLVTEERTKSGTKANGLLKPHLALEKYLERYIGLMLFVKEIDDQRYQQICASYFSTTSDLYKGEIGALLAHNRTLVRKPTEEEQDATFAITPGSSPALRAGTIKRVGTMRTPHERKQKGDMADQIYGGEAIDRALQQIGPHIYREQIFIADLLHITGLESNITFADLMDLETYFTRSAANNLAANVGRFKDLKSSMDLIFGFLNQELQDTTDFILQKDSMQIIGILAAIDRCIRDSQQAGNEFLLKVAQRQGLRCAAILEKNLKEQVKAIEQTKLTVKKRKGVVPFINIFPGFCDRIEAQLVGAEDLPIRQTVDQKYELLVNTMFECLQQMAKMGGDQAGASAEDKDQLNYHVVLIENMHHFETVSKNLRAPSLQPHIRRARDIYEENLRMYIRLVLRRPLARLLDFFEGVERLLKETPANEISLHSAYNKSSAKKAAGSTSAKDLRKAVEALSKRVEKHFTDITNPSAENAEVLVTVWRACQDEALRLTTSWSSMLSKCYSDSKVSLDFTTEDVTSAFARHKPS